MAMDSAEASELFVRAAISPRFSYKLRASRVPGCPVWQAAAKLSLAPTRRPPQCRRAIRRPERSRVHGRRPSRISPRATRQQL